MEDHQDQTWESLTWVWGCFNLVLEFQPLLLVFPATPDLTFSKKSNMTLIFGVSFSQLNTWTSKWRGVLWSPAATRLKMWTSLPTPIQASIKWRRRAATATCATVRPACLAAPAWAWQWPSCLLWSQPGFWFNHYKHKAFQNSIKYSTQSFSLGFCG